MTHFSDALYTGGAYYPSATSIPGLGYVRSHLYAHEFGAVATLTTTGVCVLVTTTGASSGLSATGSLASGGVATFTLPRAVSLTSTANNSGLDVTVNGTDAYGKTQSEKITGPNNNTVRGAKAFKTVTSVTATGIVTALSVGDSDILGLPVRVGDKGKVVGLWVDGVSETTNTIVAGLSTTGTSTATTADVRGTVLGGTATNGAKRFTALLIVDPASKESLYGVAPA